MDNKPTINISVDLHEDIINKTKAKVLTINYENQLIEIKLNDKANLNTIVNMFKKSIDANEYSVTYLYRNTKAKYLN